MSFIIQSRGEGYRSLVHVNDDGSREFIGDLDIDYDGCPDYRVDPCGQRDTSLHYEGKPLNGHAIKFIVLPPECLIEPEEIVLGCHAVVSRPGFAPVEAVVGDVGPHNKLGEGSPYLATKLGINPDPNKGGRDIADITYRYWPGQAACFDGRQFTLVSYRDLIRGVNRG